MKNYKTTQSAPIYHRDAITGVWRTTKTMLPSNVIVSGEIHALTVEGEVNPFTVKAVVYNKFYAIPLESVAEVVKPPIHHSFSGMDLS
jgi:hypothetical protein